MCVCVLLHFLLCLSELSSNKGSWLPPTGMCVCECVCECVCVCVCVVCVRVCVHVCVCMRVHVCNTKQHSNMSITVFSCEYMPQSLFSSPSLPSLPLPSSPSLSPILLSPILLNLPQPTSSHHLHSNRSGYMYMCMYTLSH